MFRRLSSLEKILFASVGFTLSLLAARALFTNDFTYFFYPWNLFLAVVPYLLSRKLEYKHKRLKSWLLIIGWLIFFPNAPYVVTDVFHFQERYPVPQWYDLILVISGAWNGLILGIVSMIQVERYLLLYIKPARVRLTCICFSLLCGYGVYVGRYWRFNSWDVVTQPKALFKASAYSFIKPHQNVQLWAFTVAFAVLFYIVYLTFKQAIRLNEKPVIKRE